MCSRFVWLVSFNVGGVVLGWCETKWHCVYSQLRMCVVTRLTPSTTYPTKTLTKLLTPSARKVSVTVRARTVVSLCCTWAHLPVVGVLPECTLLILLWVWTRRWEGEYSYIKLCFYKIHILFDRLLLTFSMHFDVLCQFCYLQLLKLRMVSIALY